MPGFTRSKEALLERQAALLWGPPVLLREWEALVRQQPVAFSSLPPFEQPLFVSSFLLPPCQPLSVF
jgi:hypothetical protein